MALLTLQPQAIPQSSLSFLPEGAAGIRATLAAMVHAARAAANDLRILDLAQSIIVAVPGKDYDGEISAIQAWVKANVRYTRDPVNLETLRIPTAMIDAPGGPQGDCDDQATLVAALAMAIGFEARFVAIGTIEPGVFEHVYAEVKLGTIWVSVETTEPVEIGWQPAHVVARMVRHIY